MNETVSKIYDINNDIWGYPQTYRGVDIYPIKLKDLKYQKIFYKLFAYPKNYIPEKKIIKMSYLKYLVFVVSQAYKMTIEEVDGNLTDFLRYVTKREDISLGWGYQSLEGDITDMIELKIMIGDIVFTELDFDNLREIILEQNGTSVEFVEEFIPSLEENLAFINKDSEDITLEDEIITFCSLMNKTINEVENYTLHQFKSHLQRLIILKDFDLYKPLVVSGQITLKSGEIKHYSAHIPKRGRYDNLLIKKDEFVEKNSELFASSQSK